MKTISIISPVYNEAEVIELFHTELRHILDRMADYRFEIVYVVDRSTDDTLTILKRIAATDDRVRILAMSARFGHQTALLAGIDHSHGDAVVMLDSDLQHPPSLIPRLVVEFENGFDVVYTVRSRSNLSSRLFYRLLSRMSNVPIDANAPDFRLISRRVADIFRFQIRERNQFIRGLVGWMGFSRTAVEFDVGKRAGGRSKYAFGRLLRFAAEGIVSFSKRPLQAAIVTGLIFSVLSLLLVIITFIQYFIYKSLPSGWTTLVIITAAFNGVQLIFLGVLGEYIGAIFDEVKARPHYIIEEQIGNDE